MKRKGESVAAGDVVAEIETDKATFEVTSPVDGVLPELFFDEGALVPVFTNIFVVGGIRRIGGGVPAGHGSSGCAASRWAGGLATCPGEGR